MLGRDESGAVSAVFCCFDSSGTLMPRDRPPIEETNCDKPIERQMCTRTGRIVGREALMTAVAISICAHVKAGSSDTVLGISLFKLIA